VETFYAEKGIGLWLPKIWQVGGGKFFQTCGQIFFTSLCSTMIRYPFFSSGTAVTTNICSAGDKLGGKNCDCKFPDATEYRFHATVLAQNVVAA
jgi:hypothetical protein